MLKTKKEVKSWLDEHKVTDYTINDDLTVDVEGYVYLYNYDLTEISVQFNVVNGWFDCNHNQLTALKGSPKEVHGDFACNHNQLTSLEGSPKIVNGYFFCHNNQLTSLIGSPKEVKGWFYCYNNQLTSLKHLPEIHGDLFCDEYLKDTKEYKVYEISKKLREMA